MKHFTIIKSILQFFIFRVINSEKYFIKSLYTYPKNYFSIIHSGDRKLDEFVPTVQYMMANILKKNINPEILSLSIDFMAFCDKFKSKSNSQFLQDLFVLYFLDKKRGGFFVEFGACDGIDLSNTLLLESELGWKGILAEPDKYYFDLLEKNRESSLSNLIVLDQSDLMVEFTHVHGDSKLSTISKYVTHDSHKNARLLGEKYNVRTISLDHLLDSYDAPEVIDYISIDTEGSEVNIIEAFSFSRKVLMFTIEHNHNPESMQRIDMVMEKHGYKRVLEGFSECDYWYVDQTVFELKMGALLNSKVL